MYNMRMKQHLQRFARRLSASQLKAATWAVGLLAVASVLIPDTLPFVDELVLVWALSELVLERRARASQKRRARDL